MMEDRERKSRDSKRRFRLAFASISGVFSIALGFILLCLASIGFMILGFMILGIMLLIGGIETISIVDEWYLIIKDKKIEVVLNGK